eukprot:scaffold33521_cov32-Tisochrysis_lutea.AAC.1
MRVSDAATVTATAAPHEYPHRRSGRSGWLAAAYVIAASSSAAFATSSCAGARTSRRKVRVRVRALRACIAAAAARTTWLEVEAESRGWGGQRITRERGEEGGGERGAERGGEEEKGVSSRARASLPLEVRRRSETADEGIPPYPPLPLPVP